MVRGDQTLRVGLASRGGRRDVVHHVTAERGKLDTIGDFGVGRARFGELAGDTPDLHDRHAGRVLQHDGHLQDDLQLVADGIGGGVVERLGAIARLEQKSSPCRDLGEPLLQGPRFTGEHERGQRRERLHDAVERGRIGPVWAAARRRDRARSRASRRPRRLGPRGHCCR